MMTTAPVPCSVSELHGWRQPSSPGAGRQPQTQPHLSMIPAREGAPICFSVASIKRQVFDADRFHNLKEKHCREAAGGDLVSDLSNDAGQPLPRIQERR